MSLAGGGATKPPMANNYLDSQVKFLVCYMTILDLKPMPLAGGGATKPPIANNYLDRHGLNPGETLKLFHDYTKLETSAIGWRQSH